MCGIFGYIGTQNRATEIAVSGLKRLDYRGYDSWGVASCVNKSLFVQKHVGKIKDAQVKFPESTTAIAHTRWATHGAVTNKNAHPHYSTDKSFVLAHNGIFENYKENKTRLIKAGYKFISQTDTEVIVRLIEEALKRGENLKQAVRKVFNKLEGRNTIIVLTINGEIIAARNGSPLVVGFGNDASEIYFSSDVLSFASVVSKILVVENGQMVSCQNRSLELLDIKTGKKVRENIEKNTISSSDVNKEGYDHYMIKEINESPYVIKQLTERGAEEYKKLSKVLKNANRIFTIGSGTAGASAAQVAFYLRTIAGLAAVSLIGAEAKDYYNLFTSKDVIVAPSQSGETADVLEVLEFAKQKKVKIISFVNMPGSMMTRLSDYKIMAQAGPEICVASTKIFVSQIAWGYLLAKSVAGEFEDGIFLLEKTAEKINELLKDAAVLSQIKKLAAKLTKSQHIFLLAKGQNLQIIKEAMVKIIEESYIHAHAIHAGDLKHYAITIMQKGVPVIYVISKDRDEADVLNAVNEVKARGATTIAISPNKNESFDEFIKVPDLGETSAILNVVPLQLLAYYMAVNLGNDVDKPRNIAKSVTVK